MDHAGADAWEVLDGGRVVGGAVVVVDGQGDRASLDLLFIDVGEHGRGIGVRVWNAIEAKYPDVEVWRTMTPCEDVRNIHFYVNKCGFRVVEFFHPGHPDPHQPSGPEEGAM
ncbi:GNAT family N-acetyltransferase [Microbacterium sp. NC79]|uniref:GNAT family N-acetyltransferase n=1 Tax=Microbacterium sp. NC79 TaxID=2851009 RepID=UPI00349F3359